MHSCALASDGEILCWGTNDQGQLARAAGAAQSHEPTPTRLGKAQMISSGAAGVTCALLSSNDLTCWGYNVFGWFAEGPEVGALATVAEGLANVRQLAVGTTHACLLVHELVECWGISTDFALGVDAQRLSFADRSVVDVPDSLQVAAGAGSCALGSDGQVRCWGGGSADAQIVTDATGEPLAAVRQIALGGTRAACAALEDGRALCWGANDTGQLGNPAVTENTLPHAVVVSDATGAPLGGVEQVAVGINHACARLSDGSVMCWGRRDRLGGGGTGSASQPFATPVRDIDDAIDIACGGSHSCVRTRSGQVRCWGDNAEGQLGVGPGMASSAVPVEVLGLP
jgi:alpha-tubulin suppressor-like RCC1 family protein